MDISRYHDISINFRTAPHGGVIFALKMVKNTGIYSVL